MYILVQAADKERHSRLKEIERLRNQVDELETGKKDAENQLETARHALQGAERHRVDLQACFWIFN
jgi:predicted  nucleic acid-binding Zn-ribbon protein